MKLTSMETNRLALWGYLGYARLGKNTIRNIACSEGRIPLIAYIQAPFSHTS